MPLILLIPVRSTEFLAFWPPPFKSSREQKAKEFVGRAVLQQDLPGVLWVVHLDPRGATDYDHRCIHVNYIENSTSRARKSSSLPLTRALRSCLLRGPRSLSILGGHT